jgi:hypothetical protein
LTSFVGELAPGSERLYNGRVLRTILLLLTMVAVLAGCGGGSSGKSTRIGRSVKVNWPARSREAISAPSSAQSLKITLVAAGPTGNDIVIEEAREGIEAYTATYPIPGALKKSASSLLITLYSGGEQDGDVVGTASATFDSSTLDLVLANIVFDGKVASVEATGKELQYGDTRTLGFSARDSEGNILALSPGSVNWTQTSGSSAFSLSAAGVVTPLTVGVGKAFATVDGVDSEEVDVAVTAQHLTALLFSLPTDTLKLTGGTLNGAVNLGTSFTVEAYVRPTANGGFIWQQWTDSDMNEVLDLSDGKIRATATGSGQPQSTFLSETLPLNVWSHVAWVYDGTNVRLYQNGVLVLTQAKSSNFAPVVSAQAAALGKNGSVPFTNSDASFSGYLAWFKVSNTARYTGATYVQPTSPGTADGSTLLLIDADSFNTVGGTYALPGTQGITGEFGVGNGSSTFPQLVFSPEL